jgi:hypothetical protein
VTSLPVWRDEDKLNALILDVPLYWQHARAATSLMEGLGREVLAAAARALRPQ